MLFIAIVIIHIKDIPELRLAAHDRVALKLAFTTVIILLSAQVNCLAKDNISTGYHKQARDNEDCGARRLQRSVQGQVSHD